MPDGTAREALPPPFEIAEERSGSHTVLRVSGELDLATAPGLRERLDALHAERADVRVDLSRLAFIDSSGIKVLLTADEQARRNGGGFSIVAASERARRALELCGLARLLD